MVKQCAGVCEQAEERFRISVNLERWFSDERARAYVSVTPRRRVRALRRRLRELFALPRAFCLVCRGHLLPPDEPLALLRPDDCVDVIPVQEDNGVAVNSDCDVLDSVEPPSNHESIECERSSMRSPPPLISPSRNCSVESADKAATDLIESKRRALSMLDELASEALVDERHTQRPRRRRVRRRRRAAPPLDHDTSEKSECAALAQHSVGVSSPLHSVDVSSPQHSVGVSSPQHSVGVSSPQHSVGVSSSQHSVGVSSSQHSVGVSSPQHSVGVSSSQHSVGVSSPQHSVGVSSSQHSVGVSSCEQVECAGAALLRNAVCARAPRVVRSLSVNTSDMPPTIQQRQLHASS